MKTMLALLLSGLTGCASFQSTGDLAVDLREATWRAMMKQLEMTIQHTQEIRALGLEADAALAPNE